jgi:hypothetical protein
MGNHLYFPRHEAHRREAHRRYYPLIMVLVVCVCVRGAKIIAIDR